MLSRSLALAGLLLAPITAKADDKPAPANSAASTVDWFVQRLSGKEPPVPADRSLSAAEVVEAQQKLWANYKAAAIQLGWDKEIAPVTGCPKLPPMEELQKLPPAERPKLPKFEAAVMECGSEKMPYLLLSRGERPAKGFPLFFQMHGGGSTGEKLAHPHAWEVNSRDWQNQVGVCLFMLPEGMYFVPRMANDNRGRWWYKHNHIAFDKIIRRSVLFRDVDPDRIYMMGISEGAYGTESLAPFWADRLAGGCAMAGGGGGGDRLYNLRNTAFRNDTGEKDTMFDRIKLATQAHDFLDALKKDDPGGYDHHFEIHPGGHSIDYRPGPAWIATKTRHNRPDKVCWYNHAVDGQRRTDFSWLSLAAAPERDTLIVAAADRAANTITVTAGITAPPAGEKSKSKNTAVPSPAESRIPYTGNTLTLHLDDKLVDLNRPVTVLLNGKQVFSGTVERKLGLMAADIVRHGDPGRVFPARLPIAL